MTAGKTAPASTSGSSFSTASALLSCRFCAASRPMMRECRSAAWPAPDRPSGSVTFSDNGATLQTVALDANGLCAVLQKAAQRAVRLGAASNGADGAANYEVLAGLAGNEQVALDPIRAGLAGARPLVLGVANAPAPVPAKP